MHVKQYNAYDQQERDNPCVGSLRNMNGFILIVYLEPWMTKAFNGTGPPKERGKNIDTDEAFSHTPDKTLR